MTETEIYILIIAIAIYAALMFIAFAMGQSRMRRKIGKLRMEQLIYIRNQRSMNKPLDAYLTDEINNLMIELGFLK